MGLMQRNKGKTFERKIATVLRAWWPDATVRRASQAERAYEPDVFIRGSVPTICTRLWLECQDAARPTPERKLEQAERDVRAHGVEGWIPVVVWHKLGERDIHVTLRMRDMCKLVMTSCVAYYEPVTMRFTDFLAVVNTWS